MKKLGIFLEVFSGVGGVSRALRRRGIDTLSIDVLKHADDEMLVVANQRRVLRMIRTNRVSGVWLGTPLHVSYARQTWDSRFRLARAFA